MGFLFDFLGSIFGYVLWFFFDAVSNYGLAITLFTLVINILMFPIAIKRQKTMAANSRLSIKQQALKKRYEKDQKKYNEELARLYEKEGVSPLSGCFATMILPLVLWSGISGAITKPLQNTLHIAPEKVVQAVDILPSIPEVSTKITKGYEELQIVRHFPELKNHLTMFNAEELADIEEYSGGFGFMGINLLGNPRTADFSEILWIIPVLSFFSSVFLFYLNQKITGTQTQMQGCAKHMPIGIALFTAYISYTFPAAVGFYWIINTVIGALQSLVLNKYYNLYTLNAHEEAARLAFLNINEKEIHEVRSTTENIK